MDALTYDKIQVRRAWVEALRSGAYEQTDGELVYEYGDRPAHCCLGVLCEVVDPGNAQGWRGEQMPPHVLEIAAGLRRPGALADLNDNEGWSFKDIARFIEEGSC